jgi:hypothetical protein
MKVIPRQIREPTRNRLKLKNYVSSHLESGSRGVGSFTAGKENCEQIVEHNFVIILE